jgi:N-acetylmuramic acid 6-phosphate etherase
MNELPQTEHANSRTAGLDQMSSSEIVALLVEEQQFAVEAVRSATHEITRAVDQITKRLRDGHRLHYVGAGTSGRLGFLDASEMPPTFGTDPSLVCAHIAGGIDALTRAVEGAEDDAGAGAREMQNSVRKDDAVIGISASGGAPYVVGAVRQARQMGAWTMGVANHAPSALLEAAELALMLQTGPEPLTGSTRLKAGTAQKILLNTISTATMIRLGKVHDNLMVDVVATNQKLRLRALRLVMHLTGEAEARASELLQTAGGNVKVAVVMASRGCDAERARAVLESNDGSLRRSL